MFSTIGTYVGLRGGNIYPTYIRKFEPKPLRPFLQDGSNDLNIYAGDWWMVNNEMERALRFSGYQVDHAWGEGGHEGKQANEIFPDAVRFLWKGWPERVAAGEGSPQMKEVLIPGEKWQLVGEGYGFTEGPAVNAKGDVFFVDVPNSKTYRIGADGKPAVFVDNGDKGDGQCFGADGRLYQAAFSKVQAFDEQGKATTITDGFRGNDIVVRPDGSLYVTEPGWDGTKPSKVWFVAPNGEKKVVDEGLKFANGVALSPDQSLLYVCDSKSHWVYSYQVQADGSLLHKQRYYDLHVPESADDAWPDGMRVDRDGRLYVCTRLGIQFCDQAGRVNGIIPTPNGKISNMTFGGAAMDTIYATCGDKVYKRKVKTVGVVSYAAPVKPAAPHRNSAEREVRRAGGPSSGRSAEQEICRALKRAGKRRQELTRSKSRSMALTARPWRRRRPAMLTWMTRDSTSRMRMVKSGITSVEPRSIIPRTGRSPSSARRR